MQAIWMCVHGCVFGVDGEVAIGAVYTVCVHQPSNGRGSAEIRSTYDTMVDAAALAAQLFAYGT